MDEILQDLIGAMKIDQPKRPPTNENLYDYYMSRVRDNLHVSLCFSPVSKNTLMIINISTQHNTDQEMSWPLNLTPVDICNVSCSTEYQFEQIIS